MVSGGWAPDGFAVGMGLPPQLDEADKVYLSEKGKQMWRRLRDEQAASM